jgi:hypothetical protein
LLRKIQTWSKVQQSYNPGAIVLRQRLAPANTDELSEATPCNIPLFLPSDISQRSICDDKLRRHEWSLRLAQAHDALTDIRHNLRLRSHLYKHKDRFSRGQKANTRSRGLITRVEDRIESAADKYDVARKALEKLSPILGETGWEGEFKVLNRKEDLRGLTEAGYGQSDGTPAHSNVEVWRSLTDTRKRQSEGRRKLSWIWLTSGVDMDAGGQKGDTGVHECKLINVYRECVDTY